MYTCSFFPPFVVLVTSRVVSCWSTSCSSIVWEYSDFLVVEQGSDGLDFGTDSSTFSRTFSGTKSSKVYGTNCRINSGTYFGIIISQGWGSSIVTFSL